MPPVIVWSVGVFGATMLAKMVVRQWHKVNDDLERLRSMPLGQTATATPLQTLRRDPRTGVYRP